MRLIDADEANKAIKKICDDYGIAYGNNYGGFADKISSVIDNMPTIDAEPVVHAHWIDKCVRDWHCSNCDGTIQKVRLVDGYCNEDLPKFCPDCGAKMDEEQK